MNRTFKNQNYTCMLIMTSKQRNHHRPPVLLSFGHICSQKGLLGSILTFQKNENKEKTVWNIKL